MDDRTARRTPVAITAARGAGRHAVAPSRAYPLPEFDDDVDAVSARLAATRALMLADTPERAAAVVATLVHDLGGALVPARFVPDGEAMPLDVSLGLGEPVLPWADPVSIGALRLTRLLPEFVTDARTVVSRLQAGARLTREADQDPRTGLLSRRAWLRALATAAEGHLVCLVRVDGGLQSAAADTAARDVGELLADALRGGSGVGRLADATVGCVVRSGCAQDVLEGLDAARTRWLLHARTDRTLDLAGGVAVVGAAGPRAALQAAGHALDRAGGGWVLAGDEDHRRAS